MSLAVRLPSENEEDLMQDAGRGRKKRGGQGIKIRAKRREKKRKIEHKRQTGATRLTNMHITPRDR
jgi:hypothetical protein